MQKGKKNPLREIVKNETRTGISKNILLLIVAGFGLLLYANSIFNGYNIDDELVTMNHRYTSKGISALPEIFANPYYKDVAGNQYEYRPVTLASFAIEHQFFGESPPISHFINILIYIALCLILFVTFSKLFSGYNYLLPLFATFLFVAHPLHTEAVASIKNRDELLSFAGGISALYFALLFAEKRKIAHYILFVFFIVFALLSKKSILPFVIIIPLTIIFFRQINTKIISLISIPLVLFAGLFTPLELAYEKAVVSILTLLIPFVFYFIFTKKDKIYKFVSAVFIFTKSIPSKIRNGTDETTGLNAKRMQWILSPFSFFAGVLFSHYDIKFALLLSAAFLIIIYIISTVHTRIFIFFDLIIFISLTAYFYRASELIFLLFVSGLSMFLTENKSKIINASLGLILLVALALALTGMKFRMLAMPISGLLIYFYIRKNYKKIVPILFFSAGVVRLFQFSTFDPSAAFYFLTAIILSFFHFFQKIKIERVPELFIASLFSLLIAVFLTHSAYIPRLSVVSEALNTVHETQQTIEKVKIIPASGRQLNFVEMPLNYSDPLSIRAGTSLVVLGKYLQLMAFPHPMGFYYGYAYIKPVSWLSFAAIFSLLVHLALLVSALYFFRTHKIYSYGVLFYLLCIFQFSNFVAPVAGILGDRLTFVASAGYCIALAYVILSITKTDMKTKKPDLEKYKIGLSISAILLFAFSAKTIARNFQWKDQITLMSRDIKYLENSVQANNIFAFNLVENALKENNKATKEKQLNQAILHFKKAVEIYPKAEYAWHDLGQTYLLLNNYNDALPAFLKAVEADSTYSKAWMKAGISFSKLNKHKEAAHCYEKVVKYEPNNMMAYSSLSEAYFMVGDIEKSIGVNLAFLEKVPTAYPPTLNIGKTYYMTGDKKNALIWFEKAYQLNNSDNNLILTIASLYKEFGENEKEEFYLSKANQTNR